MSLSQKLVRSRSATTIQLTVTRRRLRLGAMRRRHHLGRGTRAAGQGKEDDRYRQIAGEGEGAGQGPRQGRGDIRRMG